MAHGTQGPRGSNQQGLSEARLVVWGGGEVLPSSHGKMSLALIE